MTPHQSFDMYNQQSFQSPSYGHGHGGYDVGQGGSDFLMQPGEGKQATQ